MKPRMPNNTSRGNPGNIHKMLLLSLMLHLVVITALFVSVPSSSRRLTFGPIYSVQLVGSSEIASSIESSLFKDILQQGEETGSGSTILKREIASISSTPVKKEETSNLNIEKAIDAIRQKDSSHQETASPAEKSNINTSSASGGTTISQAQATSRTSEYIAVIWSRVKGNWTLPPALMPKENIKTIIDVKISRNGTLEHMGFEKSSGNRYFDDSAIKAVKKSSPFPPLPPYILGNNIELGIRFFSKELR